MRGGAAVFRIRSGSRLVEAHARGIFDTDIEIAEYRAHGIALLHLDEQLLDVAGTWRSDPHDSFVRLHFHDILIGLHLVADLDGNADDGGLGDGFTELRHDDGDERHTC